MTSKTDLFDGLKQTRCAACNAEEPKAGAPGWPNHGRFIVVRNAKLCLRCAKELTTKLNALEGTRNDDLTKMRT